MAAKKTAGKTAKSTAPKSFALALTLEELQQLDAMLQEAPAKIANPIFNFLNAVSEQRKKEQGPAKSADEATDEENEG